MNNERTFASAQVLLKAGTEPQTVRKTFADAGFSLDPLFANSFSITAPINRFETFFDLAVQSSLGGGLQFVPTGGQPLQSLQAELLPANLRDQVEVIVFSRPPDFGPLNP